MYITFAGQALMQKRFIILKTSRRTATLKYHAIRSATLQSAANTLTSFSTKILESFPFHMNTLLNMFVSFNQKGLIMNKTISVTDKSGIQYTINTNHIVFYESVKKAYYDSEEHTWRDSEDGAIIHLTNNFKPINTIINKNDIDKLLYN